MTNRMFSCSQIIKLPRFGRKCKELLKDLQEPECNALLSAIYLAHGVVGYAR